MECPEAQGSAAPPPRVNMLRGPLSEERAEALGRSGWQVLGGNDPVPLCTQKTI